MQQTITTPRLVIGAPQGRSGKTTFTVGLLAGLVNKKLAVQSFKKGPDFIDPSWHTRITGRPCRNLDRFLMSEEKVKQSLVRGAAGADVAVVEGAMGLFDGVDLQGSNSTAEISRLAGAPVVLVVDTTRMTRSVAAVVKGCMELDPEIDVAAVILNRVARSRHENMLRSAIDYYCGIPVLGSIPKGKQFNIPDRHLGLVPAAEDEQLAMNIDAVGKEAEQHLDLDGLLELAEQAGPVSAEIDATGRHAMTCWSKDYFAPAAGSGVKIGVCLDRAFSFYYPENLEALRAAGAALVAVDTLNDSCLPPVDGLYIGGGFPEVLSKELQENAAMRKQVRGAVESGMPVYAECGGLMYLGRNIYWRDEKYEMVGALPFDVEMLEKPQGHGYILLEIKRPNPYFTPGEQVKGHEFHHSRVINLDKSMPAAGEVTRGRGIDGRSDGLVYKNTFAAYTHLHALGTPSWAPSLVQKAREYREKQKN